METHKAIFIPAVAISNRYVLALFMHRKSIRAGQSQDALMTRDIESEMFYSNNMSMYMKLHQEAVITHIKTHPEVGTFQAHNDSFRISPNAGKREGWDFILEGKNAGQRGSCPHAHRAIHSGKDVCEFLNVALYGGLLHVV